MLNIASDCVINDYLKSLRKKEPFKDGIFPETLKENFGIDYDRKNDTQYSLYIKLLGVYEKNKSEMDKLADKLEKSEGENKESSSSGGSSSSNSSNGSSSSDGSSSSGGSSSSDAGNNSESKELNANDAQKAADEAKKNVEDLEKLEKSAGNNTGELKEKIDKAKDAAKRAQEAADKAKECANKGDKNGEKKAAEEAQKAAEKSNNSSQKSKGGTSPANNNDIIDSDNEKLNEIRKNAEEIIKKYKNKLTGYLGDFLSKCESSTSLKRDGLKTNTLKGQSGWNTKMNQICKAFVKKKIFQKKRQFEKTYTRVRRGSGFVKFGNPIDPGRKVKEDKMDVNVAFYIDRSGSMSNSINNVFKAVFYIAESLKKTFGKEKVVNETIFESYAFDTSLHKLKFGQKMPASGGTMSFNELLDNINKNTKDFLINVIVTDAQFSDINVSAVKDLLNEINGIIIFVTNTPNEIMEDISKKYSTKLNYILADEEFKLS